MRLVFVYGSLKRGLSNEHWLAGQEFVAEAVTEPGYRMYDWGGYPGLVETGSPDNGLAIHGEVWRVDDRCLAALDRLEDVDQGLYHRGLVRLQPPFTDVPVETYYFSRSVAGLRDGGVDWREACWVDGTGPTPDPA